MNSNNQLGRHTGGVNFALGLSSSKLPTFSEGRYPAIKNNPHSGQGQGVAPLTREIVNHLDSGLVVGQPVLSLSKGRKDIVFANGLSGMKTQSAQTGRSAT
jgi:hypothetical protein